MFGLDIDPACKGHAEDRIEIETGSQDDLGLLSRVFPAAPKFDTIIDDDSHVNRHILASFDALFNQRLKPGGLYIIEDLRCSYQKLQSVVGVIGKWPGMKYNDGTLSLGNDRGGIDSFILQHVHAMDHHQGKVLSVHCWPMVCVMMHAG